MSSISPLTHNSKGKERKALLAGSFSSSTRALSPGLFLLRSHRRRLQTKRGSPESKKLYQMARSSRLTLLVAAVVTAAMFMLTTGAYAAPSPADNAVFTNYIIPNDVDGKPVSGG